MAIEVKEKKSGTIVRYSTGIPLLDDKLGGGVPVGLTLVHGADSTGKTCLALSIINELEGSYGALIDLEAKCDTGFLKKAVGRDLVYGRPTSGEAAIEVAYTALRNGVKVVCLDTLDAMLPVSEINMKVGSREPFAQKRLVYHAAAVLGRLALRMDAAVVFISQIRINPTSRRPKPKSSFLNLIRGQTSCVLQLDKSQTMAEYGTVKFSKIKIHVERLLGYPPLGRASAYLWDGKGFDRNYELFRKLDQQGIIERKGAYWKSAGITLGPGKDLATEQISKEYNHYRRLLDE